MIKRIALISLTFALVGAGLVIGLAGAAGNDTPEGALPLMNPTAGALTGNRGGAFAFYRFDYTGKNHVAQLTLHFSPDDTVVHPAIGVTVYAPDGTAYTSSITDTLGLQQVRFASSLAGRYLVQVYNYGPGYTVSYSLTAQGIAVPAAPTPTPSGNTLVKSVAGSIAGNRGGAFAYYTLYYPGDGSTVRLSATFSPADPILNRGQGFNVYLNGRLIAQSTPDAKNVMRQAAEFSRTLGGTFLIQVYNYNHGVTAGFTLARD
jgi:hypothetical protein